MRKDTNRRFGLEFSRCVDRMTRIISETTERQTHELTAFILDGEGEDHQEVYRTSFDSEASTILNPKDIYLRLASNVELMDLYANVNQALIEENPRRLSTLFREATESLI